MREHQDFSRLEKSQLVETMTAHRQDVWNYAFFITGKQDWADEITQEVFLKAWKALHLFRQESSLSTWLFTITRNVSYDYRRKYLDKRIGLETTTLRYIEASPSAENDFFKNNDKKTICKLVGMLPSSFQDVFVLDAKYEWSMEEIAHILQISIGTVKSRLHRARRKLSKLLMNEGIQVTAKGLDY
ncbi:RNA polymerase sigma factor [Brevibacillus reuszeri]|uniref:RNA polymerase sigma factor n=1 Tax=Brevibacillus reuszeri TaxID=54915 RepID=UPI001B0D6E04|nr:RNA polymerase sigma factor [Brevibacillus reuszeri]GIO06653.1 RNA polymerase sigma factor [Brevibacillus reuszeri]